jgi:hypothetical protein
MTLIINKKLELSQLLKLFIHVYISFICDKGVTTQNLAFFSYWYRKKHLQMNFEWV